MTANSTKIDPQETELIIGSSGSRNYYIRVQSSNIRLSPSKREASNGKLVPKESQLPVELERNEELYAFVEGNETATIEVFEQNG